MVAKVLLTVFLVALSVSVDVFARPAPDSCDIEWMHEEMELVKQKDSISGRNDPLVQKGWAHFEKCRAFLNDQTKVLVDGVPEADADYITSLTAYVADPDLDQHPGAPKKFAASQISNLESIESAETARGMLSFLRSLPELKGEMLTKKDPEWMKGVVQSHIVDRCSKVYSGDLEKIVSILQYYLEKEIAAAPQNWEWLIEGRVCHIAKEYKSLYTVLVAEQYKNSL